MAQNMDTREDGRYTGHRRAHPSSTSMLAPVHLNPQQLQQQKKAQDSVVPEIDPTEIDLERQIGEGSFGKVMVGRCRHKGVAVKVLHKQTFDPKALESFRKEVAIVSRVFHPNVCLFMGACTQPGQCMIVTEMVARGDLETMLHDKTQALSLTLRMKMARDASLGMNWLHGSTPKFIHRDLKTSNLLVDENYRVKVCDFGLSQILRQGETAKDLKSAKGTPLWMAPEVMMFREFDEKCDVYSFGIVLWEILTREEPFKQFTSFADFRSAVCKRHVRPLIPEGTLPSLRDLIDACWHPEPSTRPDFGTIISALDSVIIDSAIPDEFGRSFWKATFLQKSGVQDFVPWNEWLPAFLMYMGVPPDAIKAVMHTTLMHARLQRNEDLVKLHEAVACMNILFGKTRAEFAGRVVGLEHFGRVLDVFSPVEGIAMLSDVLSLCSEEWFHGMLGAVEAVKKMAVEGEGMFMVRYSESTHGYYTISYVTEQKQVKHQRVKHIPQEGFILNNSAYSSLQELIESVKDRLGLKRPVSQNPFHILFLVDANESGGYSEMTDFGM